MTRMQHTEAVADPASGQTRHPHPFRRLAASGGLATFTAMVATTLAAALASAMGVDFVVEASAEAIPLSGIAVVTGLFSLVGVVIAAGLLHWSARPADRFVWTTLSLTVLSLVAPLLSDASGATVAALLTLHLVAAAVMIPALAISLRTRGLRRARPDLPQPGI